MIFTGSVIEEFKKFKVPVSLILGTRNRMGPGKNWKKNSVNYDFYYGTIRVYVYNDFDEISIYCYYHGYMGGKDLIKYSSNC